MAQIAQSMCRCCGASCPVSVTVEHGVVTKVEGNPDAPLYQGFICPKGRALASAHQDPDRLMHHLKRMPDGHYSRISTDDLVNEVASAIARILKERGPRAIAGSFGNAAIENPNTPHILRSFLNAIGTDRYYNNATIDQPGVLMAMALHGSWAGGFMRPENCAVYLVAGGNPIISKQHVPQNPGLSLKRMTRNGCRLIVIDPRRSETARKAHVHLQIIPGEDATIFAGLIHLIIRNGAVNQAFVGENAHGLAQLAKAVEDFTPDYVAARAGVAVADLEEAACVLGEAETGDCVSGVGINMSTRGTLNTYLMYCIKTLRGFYPKAGEDAAHPSVLTSPKIFKAQPTPPRAAWGFGRKTSVRGLQETAAGMPLPALPEEMLTPGEDQVKAYFTLGSGILNWPQSALIRRAFESLDLLVVHDVERSEMAQIATHVIATKKQFEIPCTSQLMEIAGKFPGYGWDEPYGVYVPAIAKPPEEAELLDSWNIYYRVAQKLGLQLKASTIADPTPETAPDLDMEHEPTNDELIEIYCRDATITLAEVKQYPHGHLFDEARVTIRPRDLNCQARFELADQYIMEELRGVRSERPEDRRRLSEDFPMMLISVRMQNTSGAMHRAKGLLKRPDNPLLMNPVDIEAQGLRVGDMIELRSRHGAVTGAVDIDANLRPGIVSMCFGFGKMAGAKSDPRRDGTNVNALLSMTDDHDPHHGQPRMSGVPVRVTKID